jgi:hypothetical protein
MKKLFEVCEGPGLMDIARELPAEEAAAAIKKHGIQLIKEVADPREPAKADDVRRKKQIAGYRAFGLTDAEAEIAADLETSATNPTGGMSGLL